MDFRLLNALLFYFIVNLISIIILSAVSESTNPYRLALWFLIPRTESLYASPSFSDSLHSQAGLYTTSYSLTFTPFRSPLLSTWSNIYSSQQLLHAASFISSINPFFGPQTRACLIFDYFAIYILNYLHTRVHQMAQELATWSYSLPMQETNQISVAEQLCTASARQECNCSQLWMDGGGWKIMLTRFPHTPSESQNTIGRSEWTTDGQLQQQQQQQGDHVALQELQEPLVMLPKTHSVSRYSPFPISLSLSLSHSALP